MTDELSRFAFFCLTGLYGGVACVIGRAVYVVLTGLWSDD